MTNDCCQWTLDLYILTFTLIVIYSTKALLSILQVCWSLEPETVMWPVAGSDSDKGHCHYFLIVSD